MQLVVDTNILISFFRFNPVRSIIINSDFLGIKLFTPEYAIEELNKNKLDILKYSKLNSEEVEFIIDELKKHIEIAPKELFKQFEFKAKQLIHSKDIPIFALALKLDCAIWSNEPGFKEQSEVKIFNTKELRESLKLI